MKIIYLFWLDQLLIKNIIEIIISLPDLSIEFNIFDTFLILIFLFELSVVLKLVRTLDSRSIKERVNYWIWIWTGFFLIISLLFFQKEFNKLMFLQFIGLPCSVFSIEFLKIKKSLKGVWKIELLFFFFLITQVTIRIYG